MFDSVLNTPLDWKNDKLQFIHILIWKVSSWSLLFRFIYWVINRLSGRLEIKDEAILANLYKI